MSVWTGGARSVGGRNELTRGSRPEAWLGEVAKAGAPHLLAYHRAVVRSAPTFLHFFNFSAKNRRPSLPLYDDTRIQLRALTGEKDFGAAEAYIHATKIPGNELSVILTQAPIPYKHGPDQSSTVADFWRMVHQEGVHTILSIGPHAEDCSEPEKASYFHPKAGKTVSFKPFSQVCTKKVTSTAAAVRRELRHVFKLEKKLLGGAKTERSLLHLEADWWKADMEGLPRLDEAVALVEATLEANDALGTARPPVLVHCWDGGRRSGLFAALLLACAQLSTGTCPDLATIARRVRLSRYGTLPAPLDLADLWRGLVHYAIKKGILPPAHNSVKAFQTALAHARPILQTQTPQDEFPDIADAAAS